MIYVQNSRNRTSIGSQKTGSRLFGLNKSQNQREIDAKAQVDQVVLEMFKDFCSESTVHGVRYFTEPKRHWIERTWWAISMTLSVILCAIVILSIWTKWSNRPVTVTFDDKTTSIGMIPFPAVTICTSQKFQKPIFDYRQFKMASGEYALNETILTNMSSEEINVFDAIMQTCDTRYYVDDLAIPRSRSIYETIKRIAPASSDIIVTEFWMRQSIPSFKPIYTEKGLCYTFNSINSQDIYAHDIAPELLTVLDNPKVAHWSVEDGYQLNVNESEVYPRRAFDSSTHDSLNVLVRILIHGVFSMCNKHAPGFRVSLNAPYELPRIQDDFIHISPDQTVFILIKPKVITTSNGLHGYAPHERGCYFQSEHQLRFFKSYSQQKCEMECLTNFTRKTCGCVRYFMPRDNSTNVCTIQQRLCYRGIGSKFKNEFHVKQCDCLPDCISISYNAHVSPAKSNYLESVEAHAKFLNKTRQEGVRSSMQINFKENYFISMKRLETSTMSDFVASCGGLLGLFMGVSMLSVIELIYFFTLRLCCRLRKQMRIHADTQINTMVFRRNHFPMEINGRRH